MMLVLPVFCCVLMALCIILLGRKGFFLSVIPVLLGVVFFVYSALSSYDTWVPIVLSVLLCLVTAVVYTATVFGWIRTKWLLPPLFALPFLYHVIMVDIPALSNSSVPISLADGMKEMSFLGIMLALFCVSMALKKALKKRERALGKNEEPAPAPAPEKEPTPAPAPEAPEAPAKPDETPVFSDEPYTPVLTLNPEPWQPEQKNTEEGGNA